MIFRVLKGLEDMISYSVVNPITHSDGWTFHPGHGVIPDPIGNAEYLHEVYTRADSNYTGLVTVPTLWDKQQDTLVSNESSEIIRMFNTLAAALGSTATLCPPDLLTEVDAMITANYETVNNGVYKSGFARSQAAYDTAVSALFNRLDELENHLEGRTWLVGAGQGTLTEADVCLFTTLVRFDLVYVVHFKCNLQRIVDYPNLQAFVDRMLELPEIRETCDWTHIKHHYFWSHQHMNPYRIVPMGPRSGPHQP